MFLGLQKFNTSISQLSTFAKGTLTTLSLLDGKSTLGEWFLRSYSWHGDGEGDRAEARRERGAIFDPLQKCLQHT